MSVESRPQTGAIQSRQIIAGYEAPTVPGRMLQQKRQPSRILLNYDNQTQQLIQKGVIVPRKDSDPIPTDEDIKKFIKSANKAKPATVFGDLESLLGLPKTHKTTGDYILDPEDEQSQPGALVGVQTNGSTEIDPSEAHQILTRKITPPELLQKEPRTSLIKQIVTAVKNIFRRKQPENTPDPEVVWQQTAQALRPAGQEPRSKPIFADASTD